MARDQAGLVWEEGFWDMEMRRKGEGWPVARRVRLLNWGEEEGWWDQARLSTRKGRCSFVFGRWVGQVCGGEEVGRS